MAVTFDYGDSLLLVDGFVNLIIAEQLVEEAAKAAADLLVMGAYGRSRMRETIFGGATRSVLNESALPLLMAH